MKKYKVVIGMGIGEADDLHFDRMIEYTFDNTKTYIPVFDVEEDDLDHLRKEILLAVNNMFDKFINKDRHANSSDT
jgi:hypothetical protein